MGVQAAELPGTGRGGHAFSAGTLTGPVRSPPRRQHKTAPALTLIKVPRPRDSRSRKDVSERSRNTG